MIFDVLLHPGMRPFEIAVGIVFGLMVLELIANQIGGSLLGNADNDLDLDVDADLDVDIDAGVDEGFAFDPGLDGAAEAGDLADDASIAPSGGALSWLGMGDVPFMIWFAGMLTAFGLTGYVIQIATMAVLGTPLGALTATAIALGPAVVLGSRVAKGIGRLLPKTTTTAISRQSYGRRRGVITVGTARAGHPAQARFTDGHGNMHFAMVEPFDRGDEIPQGAEVLIIRTKEGSLKAVRISDDS